MRWFRRKPTLGRQLAHAQLQDAMGAVQPTPPARIYSLTGDWAHLLADGPGVRALCGIRGNWVVPSTVDEREYADDLDLCRKCGRIRDNSSSGEEAS